MLLHNVIPTSVEASLPFAANHAKQDILCDWVPANSWNISSHHAQCSHDGSNSLPASASDSFGKSNSNGMCKRRKLHQNSLVIFPIQQETDESSTDTIKSTATAPIKTHWDYAIDDGGQASTIPVQNCKRQIVSIDGPADSQLLSATLDKGNSFSSLNLEKRVGTPATSIEASPNPELVVLGEDHRIRNICISVLRNYGLLVGDWTTSNDPIEVVGNSEDSNIFQYCELCGILDNISNMMLCDHCEGAFHVSCCNPKTKMLSVDEWFCQTCSKLDDKVSLEASFLKSQKMRWWNGRTKFKLGPIAAMLKYPEPYTSHVRIGDSFQAAVPQWSEQISRDFDCIPEPLEMDPAEMLGLHGSCTDKHLKSHSVSNWLQCQEVLYYDAGKRVEGSICGKWRRAPLSEVQTNEWDCSCSVLWDPSHSDCAVPQELETDEVLRQLKYVDKLRSRLAAKKSTNS